jgi:hypothetical protein
MRPGRFLGLVGPKPRVVEMDAAEGGLRRGEAEGRRGRGGSLVLSLPLLRLSRGRVSHRLVLHGLFDALRHLLRLLDQTGNAHIEPVRGGHLPQGGVPRPGTVSVAIARPSLRL